MADEIVWPLRGVSKDPGNLIKLGTDGQVMTAQADLDARFVNVTGDTMTGPLIVKPLVGPAAPDGSLKVIGDNTNAQFVIQRNSNTPAHATLRFLQTRGTTAAPLPPQANDQMGSIGWEGVRTDGTSRLQGGYIAMNCTAAPLATDTIATTVFTVGVGNGTSQPIVLRLEPNSTLITSTDSAGSVNIVTGTASSFAISQRDSRTPTGSYVPVAIQPQEITLSSNDANGTLGIVSASTGGFFVTQRDPRTPTGQYGALYLQPNSCSMWGGGAAAQFDTGVSTSGNGELIVRTPKAEFACTGTGEVYVLSKQAGIKNIFFYTPSNANLAFQDCEHFTIGAVGTLTYGFECNRTAVFRQGVDVTGNITASGTAHSFANGSIPSPAVIGNIPRTIAATGSAGISGQMVWDDNFIYLRTTGGWKKVALTAI